MIAIPLDRQGRYTLTGLGPYAWPLLFQAAGAASQWSGGTPNRNEAKRIQVTAGASATHNIVLQPATRISATLAAGRAPATGFVQAYNTETGEPVGVGLVGQRTVRDPRASRPVREDRIRRLHRRPGLPVIEASPKYL